MDIRDYKVTSFTSGGYVMGFQSNGNPVLFSDLVSGSSGVISDLNKMFSYNQANNRIDALLDFYSTKNIRTDVDVSIGNILHLDPITEPASLVAGDIFYNSSRDVLTYQSSISGVNMDIGREMWIPIYATEAISNGQPVYLDGTVHYNGFENISGVKLASNDSFVTSRVVGVATHNIPIGTYGFITSVGEVHSTSVVSSFTNGDILYLGLTPGSYMTTAPTGGSFPTRIGHVVDASAGTLSVGINNADFSAEVDRVTGWTDSSDSYTTITIDDATLNISVAPVGASFYYYEDGAKYEFSTTQSFNFANTEGVHLIYFNGASITEIINPTIDQRRTIQEAHATICNIYWSVSQQYAIFNNNERHSAFISRKSLSIDKDILRAKVLEGFSLTNIIADGDGSLDTHAQFGVAIGSLRNQDIVSPSPAYASTYGLKVFYRTGTSNFQYSQVANFSLINTGTGRLAYNLNSGGVWSLAEVPDNDYVLIHVMTSNAVRGDIAGVILGQNTYSTLPAAKTGAEQELYSLVYDELPTRDIAPIATIIFQTRTAYTNSVKARIVATTDGSPYIDWRFSSVYGIGGALNIPDSFLDHFDTPSSYAGYAGKHLRVNALESSVEFDNFSTNIATPASSQLLQFNGTDWANWTPNYATRSGSFTDNAILRSNGTTGDIQTSLAYIDDLGNLNIPTGSVYKINNVQLSTSYVVEGSNLYYTDARVSANTNVAANTAARHNAVTLGTPNGLSLSTQILSLGLSSSTTNGALSSTDWNTFNNKQAALSGTGIVKSSAGTISYLTDNSANWNTAYGWGDWSSGVPSAIMTFTNKSGAISQWTNDIGYLTTYTNNYLTGVTGSGNGTVTFTRNGLTNLTWDASHNHDTLYVPLTRTINGYALSSNISLASTDLIDTSNIARYNSGTSFTVMQSIDFSSGSVFDINYAGLVINRTGATSDNFGSAIALKNSLGKGYLITGTGTDFIVGYYGGTSTSTLLHVGTTGNLNIIGQYQVNGTQIASTDLSDGSNLAKLNANQTFTGINTISTPLATNPQQSKFRLNTINWFNLSNASGYGAINWFTDGDGTNWINTHPSVKAAQIYTQSGELQFKISSSNTGIGANSNLVTIVNINSSGINTTGQYQVNGTQISSSNLSDGSNLAKLNAANNFMSTGINSFAGQVGIGTTSPIGRLNIVTGTSNTFDIINQPNASISLNNGTGGAALPIVYGKSNITTGLFIGAGTIDSNTSGDVKFNVRTTTNTDYTTLTNRAYVFTRFNTDLASLYRNGNFNIIGQYQINGTQIASTDLADGTSIWKTTNAGSISYDWAAKNLTVGTLLTSPTAKFTTVGTTAAVNALGLDSNGNLTTNVPSISSGSYSPTITNVTNVSGVTVRSASYINTGNVVYVAIFANVTTGAVGATSFRFSLPVTNAYSYLTGTVVANTASNVYDSGIASYYNSTTAVVNYNTSNYNALPDDVAIICSYRV